MSYCMRLRYCKLYCNKAYQANQILYNLPCSSAVLLLPCSAHILYQRSRVNFLTSATYEVKYCTAYDSTAGVCNCTGTWLYARDPSKGGDFQVNLSTDFLGVTISGILNDCIEFDSLGRPYYNTTCNTATSCNNSLGATVTVQYSGESDKTITVATQTGMGSY